MAGGRCAVRFTRRYAEAPAEVWKALTDPSALGRWLAPGFEVRPTEVEPGRLVELDWRPPGEAELGMRATRFWFAALTRLPLGERT